MSTSLRPLGAPFRGLHQKLKSRAEACQREIDALLKEAAQPESLSWKNAFAYAKKVVLFSLLRYETHVAILAVFAIVVGSSIFIPFGTADIPTRLSLIGVAMLAGTSLSLFWLYLLLPFHIRHRLSLWLVASIHSLGSAIAFSLLEPEIIKHFHSYSVPIFSEIVIPVLLLYILADLFVLWQIKRHICVLEYRNKHQSEHLETLLPAEKRGEVLLLSAADHYVEFTTTQGKHMRRMTMKAAVERAPQGEGLRVHRSHWVAYKAMLSLEKDGERYILTLRSGQRVPVSPKALPMVQCELSADCLRAAE